MHCPRCRRGKLFKDYSAYNFKHTFDMHEECPVCKQKFDMEPGFWYGTGYVSYAISIAFLVATFIAWKVLIGMTFSVDDNRIFYWMGTAFILLLIFQPLIMRLSRSLWLSWFVSYDPDWKDHPIEEPERIVPEQMNNW